MQRLHISSEKPNNSVIQDHVVAIGGTIETGIIVKTFRSFLLGDVTTFSV